MKYILLIFTLFSVNYFYSQQKYIETRNGKIVDSVTFEKDKTNQIEEFKKKFGKDKYFNIINEFEQPKKVGDSVIYKIKSTMFSSFPPEINYKNNFNKNKLVGHPLPIKSLETLEGKIITADDLKGKPTILNFWYTGCGPCIREMPILNQFQKKYKDSINFIAITFDNSESVKKFLTKHEFNFIQVINAKDFMNSIQFKEFPKTFYLDKNGIVKKIEDVVTPENKNEMENSIETLLKTS